MKTKHERSLSLDQSAESDRNKFPIKSISIAELRLDCGTQTRVGLNRGIVKDYAERMADEGASAFPPIVVFQDDENNFVVADGFHRVQATRKNGEEEIVAEVRPGTCLDALKHSLGANNRHGVRRTNADKRRSVELALENEVLCEFTDRRLAELCGVGNQLIGDVRRDRKQIDSTQVCESHSSRPPAKRKGRKRQTLFEQ